MNRVIHTERLLLREMTLDDAEDVFMWVSNPKVNRYLPYSVYTDIEEVKKWIASLEKEKNEFGFELKDTGHLIGAGSVNLLENDMYEIGYNFKESMWNKGYATEAVQAMITWAKDHLHARHFLAIYANSNIASGKVLLKCGFTFDRFGEYATYDGSETFPASFYVLHLE